MRRFAMLVVTTAALALPMLALAAPASAENRCYTVYVDGFHTVESCLPLPDLDLG